MCRGGGRRGNERRNCLGKGGMEGCSAGKRISLAPPAPRLAPATKKRRTLTGQRDRRLPCRAPPLRHPSAPEHALTNAQTSSVAARSGKKEDGEGAIPCGKGR